ncbi:CopG family transcriptional regulator [Staphylococcus arlettae]|nr:MULTISPECIES: ribbon-helix-helix protein, CopG family [Staphylococcus]NKE86056.1 CopG family transcriptional regulator [Staphylococcus arlettae]URN40522.1 ribbon-helix-helix protein, CopG family [Staphylococcus arlettae]
MTKRIQVTLKDDMANRLNKLSEELGVSKSVVITLALQKYEEDIQARKG